MQESGVDLEFDLHLDDLDDDGTFDLFGEVKHNLSLSAQQDLCDGSVSSTASGIGSGVGLGLGLPEEDISGVFTNSSFYELRSTPVERYTLKLTSILYSTYIY